MSNIRNPFLFRRRRFPPFPTPGTKSTGSLANRRPPGNGRQEAVLSRGASRKRWRWMACPAKGRTCPSPGGMFAVEEACPPCARHATRRSGSKARLARRRPVRSLTVAALIKPTEVAERVTHPRLPRRGIVLRHRPFRSCGRACRWLRRCAVGWIAPRRRRRESAHRRSEH